MEKRRGTESATSAVSSPLAPTVDSGAIDVAVGKPSPSLIDALAKLPYLERLPVCITALLIARSKRLVGVQCDLKCSAPPPFHQGVLSGFSFVFLKPMFAKFPLKRSLPWYLAHCFQTRGTGT